ncbi:TPA: hypothetical protein ACQUH7_000815, partial [Neisseria lactamica]
VFVNPLYFLKQRSVAHKPVCHFLLIVFPIVKLSRTEDIRTLGNTPYFPASIQGIRKPRSAAAVAGGKRR